MPSLDEMNVNFLDKTDRDKKIETTQKIVNSVFGAIPYIGPAVSEILNSYKLFNAMQDSYLNHLVVYGIATCTGDPKKGQSSFKLLPYGQVIYQSIFDENFFQ